MVSNETKLTRQLAPTGKNKTNPHGFVLLLPFRSACPQVKVFPAQFSLRSQSDRMASTQGVFYGTGRATKWVPPRTSHTVALKNPEGTCRDGIIDPGSHWGRGFCPSHPGRSTARDQKAQHNNSVQGKWPPPGPRRPRPPCPFRTPLCLPEGDPFTDSNRVQAPYSPATPTTGLRHRLPTRSAHTGKFPHLCPVVLP